MSQIKVLLGITVINLSLLAVFASPIEPFGSSAIDAIFSRKENAIVLFLDDSEASTNLLSIATAFAEDTPGDVSISYILKESNADHFTRFSQHIGIDVSETPKLLVIVARKDRYLYKGEPI